LQAYASLLPIKFVACSKQILNVPEFFLFTKVFYFNWNFTQAKLQRSIKTMISLVDPRAETRFVYDENWVLNTTLRNIRLKVFPFLALSVPVLSTNLSASTLKIGYVFSWNIPLFFCG